MPARREFVASLIALPLLGAVSGARLRLRRRDHVVVVGAGAFGGWTALALLRAGFRVTLIDAWGAGNARASSGGETRVIRAVYNGEPVYTRMVHRALALWRDAEQRWGRQVFFPVGALWMCAGDDAYVRRSMAPMRDVGLPIEELTPADACGPWMGSVFPDVVGRRIRPTRQEVFFFGTGAGSTEYDALPAWVHMSERIVYGVPGNERRGLKVADDSPGPEVDPTSLDRVPSAEGLARAREILSRRFPRLAGAPLLEARVCQYEASPDGHFLIDRHPGLENVWLAGGGSGHGFKMGPALGEHVAGLVAGTARVEPLFRWR